MDEESKVVQEETSAPEVSEVEKEALSKNWNPEGVKSAEEFLRAEPLYEEIKASHKKVAELEKAIKEMASLVKNQQKVATESQVHKLQEMRTEAISLGDIESVNKIESQIVAAQSTPLGEHPAVTEFKVRNKEWIDDPSYKSQQMRDFALARDVELAKFNLDPIEHMKILESDVQEKFSVKTFKAKVESGTPPAPQGKGITLKTMTPEQKAFCKFLTDHGHMTAEQYIQSINEANKHE